VHLQIKKLSEKIELFYYNAYLSISIRDFNVLWIARPLAPQFRRRHLFRLPGMFSSCVWLIGLWDRFLKFTGLVFRCEN
jgi:hypothetical protein